MIVSRLALIISCAIVPTLSQAVAQTRSIADCWQPSEVAAAHMRNLDSYLVVQALKCQDTVPAAVESYNNFLETKRPLVLANGKAIMAHFVRRYGPADGPAALSDYETRLTNYHSSATIDVAQCQRAAAYARMAAAAADEDLPTLADMVTTNMVIADCPAPPSRAAMVSPVWPRPLPTRPGAAPLRADDQATASADPQGYGAPPAYGAPLAPPGASRRAAAPATDQTDAITALRAATDALNRVAGSLGAAPSPAQPQDRPPN